MRSLVVLAVLAAGFACAPTAAAQGGLQNSKPTCPQGQTARADGTCVASSVIPVCPAGQKPGTNSQNVVACVPEASAPATSTSQEAKPALTRDELARIGTAPTGRPPKCKDGERLYTVTVDGKATPRCFARAPVIE